MADQSNYEKAEELAVVGDHAEALIYAALAVADAVRDQTKAVWALEAVARYQASLPVDQERLVE